MHHLTLQNVQVVHFASHINGERGTSVIKTNGGIYMELIVDHVSKQYKNKIAVDRISLQLSQGVYDSWGQMAQARQRYADDLRGVESDKLTGLAKMGMSKVLPEISGGMMEWWNVKII